MQANDKEDKKSIYRIGRLTVLELMTVLAALGILLTWVGQTYFS